MDDQKPPVPDPSHQRFALGEAEKARRLADVRARLSAGTPVTRPPPPEAGDRRRTTLRWIARAVLLMLVALALGDGLHSYLRASGKTAVPISTAASPPRQ